MQCLIPYQCAYSNELKLSMHIHTQFECYSQPFNVIQQSTWGLQHMLAFVFYNMQTQIKATQLELDANLVQCLKWGPRIAIMMMKSVNSYEFPMEICDMENEIWSIIPGLQYKVSCIVLKYANLQYLGPLFSIHQTFLDS